MPNPHFTQTHITVRLLPPHLLIVLSSWRAKGGKGLILTHEISFGTIIFIVCWCFALHVCLCEVSDPLELELQTDVSCYMVAGN